MSMLWTQESWPYMFAVLTPGLRIKRMKSDKKGVVVIHMGTADEVSPTCRFCSRVFG